MSAIIKWRLSTPFQPQWYSDGAEFVLAIEKAEEERGLRENAIENEAHMSLIGSFEPQGRINSMEASITHVVLGSF